MESTKNLCAQIPVSLHERIRSEQEKSEQTLSQYITQIITEYYERGVTKTMNDTRTMAIQISDELFERLKAYLKASGVSQKQFLTDLIEKALNEANA